VPVVRRDNSNRRKWRPDKALQLKWAPHALRTSIAPITVFGCSSVVGVGLPTQLNLDVGLNHEQGKKGHNNQEQMSQARFIILLPEL